MINHKEALTEAEYNELIERCKAGIAQRVMTDENIMAVVSKICELIPVVGARIAEVLPEIIAEVQRSIDDE